MVSAIKLDIEDQLIELRDEGISIPFVANGLVVRSRAGDASSVIRIPTMMAVEMILARLSTRLGAE